MADNPVHVYFHSPCFDGTISAVLLYDHLRALGHKPIALHPVNYNLNDTWADSSLQYPAAIVDFLYHPDARIWFDHHPTTFLTPQQEADFRRRHHPMLVYDKTCTSCALLIWRTGIRMEGDHLAKVQAADLIDSARYESPEQAVFSDAPAFKINATLAIGETANYSVFLVEQLLQNTLEATAEHPEVCERYEQFKHLRDVGMSRFVPTANLPEHDGFVLTDEGILLFSVDGSDAMVSRYAPFTVAPDARYSLGVVRTGDRAKITAMRNPWKDFPSVPLGEIFRTFGGGGHQRVASTRLHGKTRGQTIDTLFDVMRAIQAAVNSPLRGAPV